jgi:hypothetical protein
MSWMLDALAQRTSGVRRPESVVTRTQDGSISVPSDAFETPKTCISGWPHRSKMRPV